MKRLITSFLFCVLISGAYAQKNSSKTRVIITTDGEIDDECSMVRCLLYANEWDIEGIITSSSQYHWQGHKWAGDNWMEPYLDAHQNVFPNPVLHHKSGPSFYTLANQGHFPFKFMEMKQNNQQ